VSLRSVINTSYAFVRSVEANRANVTFDHVLEQQVKMLKAKEKRTIASATGDSLGTRTSRYDRITAMETQLNLVIQAIEETQGRPSDLLVLGISEGSGQVS
jgi:hypothetical protein